MLGSRRTKDFQAISGCMLLQNCGEKVTDIHTAYEAADFDEEFVLKKGKKKFCKIVYK